MKAECGTCRKKEVKQMIFDEVIKEINRLARKKRQEGLTEEELAQQKELYKIYLANIRGQLKAQLDCIEIVDDRPKS